MILTILGELRNVDFKENEKGINSASSAFEKSFGFNTRHQLTYIPYIMNQDHSVRLFFKGEMVSGTSSSQFLSSYLLPSGTITSGTAGGFLNETKTGAGHWRKANWVLQGHYAYQSKYSLDLALRGEGNTRLAKSTVGGIFIQLPAVGTFRMKNGWTYQKWLSMFAVRFGWGVTGTQPPKEDTHFSVYGVDGGYINSIGMRPNNVRFDGFDVGKNSLRGT